jgi:predicted transcriptional regulator
MLNARIYLESITFCLAMEHLGALEIHAEINSVLGQGTVGYSTITRYLRKRSSPHSSESAEEEAEIGICDTIDRTILPALNEQPFSSLRQLAKMTLISVKTIRYHLVDRMG